MVATEPNFQRRGFATAVMRRLAEAISDFELGGLCPAEPELYAKLGWVFWRGPLFIRAQEGLVPTPDERIMILRLPKTPTLDLKLPVSAEWREGKSGNQMDDTEDCDLGRSEDEDIQAVHLAEALQYRPKLMLGKPVAFG